MLGRRSSRLLLSAFALSAVIFPVVAAGADDTGVPEAPPPTTAAPAPPTTVAPAPPVTEPPPTTVAPAPPPTVVPAPEPTPASEEPVNPAAPPPAVHPAAPGAAPVAPEGGGGIVAVVPLKAPHAGVPADGGDWPHNGPECEGVVLEPGQVLWHFVLGPLSGATNAGTTLNSAQWSLAGLHPEDTPGGGLQGANADWIVINSFDTSPTDLTATTDGALETNNPNDPPGTLQTELRISHTCGAGAPAEGSLDVLKVVSGSGEPDPGATFTIEVDCDDDAFDTTLVFDADGNLTSGTSPITGIPVGTQCTVTETGDGGADGVTYNPGGANPPTVTITQDGQTVTVTVTNNFIQTGPGGVDNPPDNPDRPGTVPTVAPGNAVPLARTGLDTGPLVALAIVLIGGGLVVLTIRRRLIGRTG